MGAPADRPERRDWQRSSVSSIRCWWAGGTLARGGIVPCSGSRWIATSGTACASGFGPRGGVADTGRSRGSPPGCRAVAWRPSLSQDEAGHDRECRQPKAVGEPYAGNPPVRFEVAGGGHQDCGPRRHSLTLPSDCLQRPLRSRFRQRLTPGVAMTSDVKRWQQIFSGLHDVFSPSGIGRAGASTMRRLILLLSVGFIPPDWHPSGACLTRGSSVLY